MQLLASCPDANLCWHVARVVPNLRRKESVPPESMLHSVAAVQTLVPGECLSLGPVPEEWKWVPTKLEPAEHCYWEGADGKAPHAVGHAAVGADSAVSEVTSGEQESKSMPTEEPKRIPLPLLALEPEPAP